MGMKSIDFPGGKVLARQETIALGDLFKVTFSDGGFFSHDVDQVFVPELFTGHFNAKESTSGTAVKFGQTNAVAPFVWTVFSGS